MIDGRMMFCIIIKVRFEQNKKISIFKNWIGLFLQKLFNSSFFFKKTKIKKMNYVLTFFLIFVLYKNILIWKKMLCYFWLFLVGTVSGANIHLVANIFANICVPFFCKASENACPMLLIFLFLYLHEQILYL